MINIRIIIYLRDMLLMGRTLPEIFIARDIDFSNTAFGFCDQPQKTSPSPCETNRVSGLSNSYREMTLALSKKKLKHRSQQCQDIFMQTKTSALNLTKLIDLLLSTMQSFLPARIQFRYLQQEKILDLHKKTSYSSHVTMGNLAREKLLWWMEN